MEYGSPEWVQQQQEYQQEMLGYERQRAAARQTVGGILVGGVAGYVIVMLGCCLGIPLLLFAIWMLIVLCSVIYHWPVVALVLVPVGVLCIVHLRRRRARRRRQPAATYA